MPTVLRDTNFQLVTEFIKLDAKKRVTLRGAGGAYNVYRNQHGQFILDPVEAVPIAEAWLHKNSKALASVKKGLKESARGKTAYRGSFAKHAKG